MKSIGVLTCDRLIVQDGLGYREFPFHPEAMELDDWYAIPWLLQFADTWRLGQLWIHPSVNERYGVPTVDPTTAGDWVIRPALPTEAPWYSGYLSTVHGEAIQLAIPAVEDRAAWRNCTTGQDLLEQVQAFNGALQFQYAWSPGSTGVALMRAVHPKTLDRFDAVTPPPVVYAHPEPARDFHWIRALLPDEQQYTYLHAFDKNAMYPGAASSLELGYGDWEHDGEMWMADFAMEGLLPGYFNIAHCGSDGGLPLLAPDITNPDGARDSDSPLWVTTPVLDAMLKAGYDCEVSESYTWSRHARLLAPWQARIRDARLALQDQPQAVQTLKNLYTQAIGFLGHQGYEGRNGLYRPEWRHLVIGQAAANLWRQAVQVVKAGVPVVGVNTDCLYVLSNEPSGRQTGVMAGLKFGIGIGEWKIASEAVPLDVVRDVFAIEDVGVGELGRRLSQWRKGRAGEVQTVGGSARGAATQD